MATKVNDVWQFVIYDAFGKIVAEYGTQGEGVGGVSYVLQDWQGSVRASVNNNGFIQARFDFTAFGEEVSLGVGLRSLEQGYTGDATTKQGYGLTEKDSSGQNHTWFRKQEQKAGRWTSPDPYKGSMSLGDPQSFNRYNYVKGQPTNFVDPNGLNAEPDGTACSYSGKFEQDGVTPIYDGTFRGGRCISNYGPPVQVFSGWIPLGNNNWNPFRPLQNQTFNGVGREDLYTREERKNISESSKTDPAKRKARSDCILNAIKEGLKEAQKTTPVTLNTLTLDSFGEAALEAAAVAAVTAYITKFIPAAVATGVITFIGAIVIEWGYPIVKQFVTNEIIRHAAFAKISAGIGACINKYGLT